MSTNGKESLRAFETHSIRFSSSAREGSEVSVAEVAVEEEREDGIIEERAREVLSCESE
jgi:hypothetical protein